MYASVTIGDCQPGKMDEFIATWRDSVKPVVKTYPGFKNIFLLTNTELNKGVTIAFYETKADAERTQSSGDFQKVVEILASTLAMETVVREGYEVSVQA